MYPAITDPTYFVVLKDKTTGLVKVISEKDEAKLISNLEKEIDQVGMYIFAGKQLKLTQKMSSIIEEL